MKYLIPTVMVLSLILSACAPSADVTVTSYPNDDQPSNSSPPQSYPNDSATPPMSEYSPKPDDTSLTRGQAYVGSSDVLTLESFPLQFMLHIVGNLPTPCNALRVAVSAPDAENKIVVDVYSVSDPDRMCSQVIQPFDVNIPLGSFPEGKYSIWVNGEMVAEIQA